MELKDSDLTEMIRKMNGIDIDLPDLQPNEPRLTHEQFDEIQRLTRNVLPDDLVLDLGKWQAAHVIYKLKEVDLDERLSEERAEEEGKYMTIVLIALFCMFVMFAMYFFTILIKYRQ